MPITIPAQQPYPHPGVFRQSNSPRFDFAFRNSSRGSNIFVNEISKGGVAWTFDETVEAGYFIDGSPWVALNSATVNITQITPASIVGRNGGMVNPDSTIINGADDRLKSNTYDHSQNVTSVEKLPRLLTAGESYVQCISKIQDATGDDTELEEIQVLTVLATAPPANSFRPGYSGTEKLIFNENDLVWSNLPSLANVANTPTIAECAAYFAGGPYIKIRSGFADRDWHAKLNHPASDGNYSGQEYGRAIAKNTGKALLRAMLEGDATSKRSLVVGLVQAGIDCYTAAKAGLRWNADGGHNQGAKMLVMFAAKMLESQELYDVANWGITDIFQEDQQTFYIAQENVDISNDNGPVPWAPDDRNGTPVQYESADLGRAEWGIKNYNSPDESDMNWRAIYRHVSGAGQFMHCVAAYLMGVQNEWNNSAWFDYFLNHYYIRESGNDPSTNPESGIGGGANSITNFASDVYLAHINPTPSNTIPVSSSINGMVQGQVAIVENLEPR